MWPRLSVLQDPVEVNQQEIGGAHAALVTAVATKAFEQAILMLRPAGTVIFIGVPGGKGDELHTSISAITGSETLIRGSNVGTRLDLQEAIDFAKRGLVRAKITTAPLEAINTILDDMRRGKIVGRMVLRIAE
jgi:alcohol dehydrogenase, propanol-preferring